MPPQVRLDLLIVDDSETDARLLVETLRRGGFDPTPRRVDSTASLRAAMDARPWDLVVFAASVPGLHAMEALAVARATRPEVPFVVVSGTLTEDGVVEAIRNGAADYVTRRNLHRLNAVVARELGAPRAAPAGGPRLTPRQREVLKLAAEGHSTKEIAVRLRLSPKTVETHRSQIMARLGIHNLAGLVRYAVRAGMVSPHE